MSYLYVCEQGATIGVSDNRFNVEYKNGMIKSIPVETLEVIEVFGGVQVTTKCITECLKRGVNIIFYSTNGAYYGRLISTSHVNVQRQRIQAALYDDMEFKVAFSKRIIDAKIRNQVVILRRYSRNSNVDISHAVTDMQYMCKKIQIADTIEQVMGYEGMAARLYFKRLGDLINPEFKFDKRSRRPPLDPFNSLISLGYSVIMNELYGKIEGKGLNPYFGIMNCCRKTFIGMKVQMVSFYRKKPSKNIFRNLKPNSAQKSAFEALIPENLYRDLIGEIPKLIYGSEDTVRVYKIRGNGEVCLFGQSPTLKNEEVIII